MTQEEIDAAALLDRLRGGPTGRRYVLKLDNGEWRLERDPVDLIVEAAIQAASPGSFEADRLDGLTLRMSDPPA